MIYRDITDPLTLTDALRAVRAALTAAGYTQPADDPTAAGALQAALTAWDAADPLIYYYRPGTPTVHIPHTWRVTDCYAGDPEPDHAVTWQQSGSIITADTPAPAWRVIWARETPSITHYATANATADDPPPIIAYADPQLTLDDGAAFHIPPNEGQTVAVLPARPTGQPWHGLYTITHYDAPTGQWLLSRITTDDYIPVRPPVGPAWWRTPAGWHLAPPARGNIARHHATLIAQYAAALIVTARTPDKHPAADWAKHILNTPWPPSERDTISHGIRTRADYM